jgi:hypothetical protein
MRLRFFALMVVPVMGVSGALATGAGPAADAVVSGPAAVAATWGTAKPISGPGGTGDQIEAMSCASAGNCTAGGEYYPASSIQGMVVTETGGTWGKAEEVPGTGKLNTGDSAVPFTLSCASAGNCVVGGGYLTSNGNSQAFVANQTGGTWGNAIEVPGTGKLNTAAYGGVYALSCASAGNCSAGGWYRTATSGGGLVAALPAAAAGSRLAPAPPAPSRRPARTRQSRAPVPRALAAARPRPPGIRHR